MPKFIVSFLRYLNKQNKYFFVFLGILLLILIGVIDYLTLDFFVFEFYLLPVLVAAWFAGRNTGILLAFIAAVSEVVLDILTTPIHSSPFVHYWNFLLNFSFFIGFVYLLVFLRKTLINLESVSESERMINRQLHVELEYRKQIEEKLRDLSDKKSIFVANVSHELKGPLGVIRESLNLLIQDLAGKVSIEEKRVLEIGKNNIERLIRLTANLLDVSRIEAGKMELKREEIEIGSLVEEIAAEYSKEILKKQIIFKRNVPGDIGLFWADKDKISQVIINLLSNAIKYTPPQGYVTIDFFGTDNEIRFEILNTGPGITQEAIGKLFNKFERIFAEKEEGTGLGLSIAKGIIELHKGKIWVESELGKWTKFIFVLPRNARKSKLSENIAA